MTAPVQEEEEVFATDEERRMAALKDKYAKANEKQKVWDDVDQRWKNVEDDEKVWEASEPSPPPPSHPACPRVCTPAETDSLLDADPAKLLARRL